MTTRVPFKWTISEQAWGLDALASQSPTEQREMVMT